MKTSPPKVTMRDVAHQAGTAISTVSLALSGAPGVRPETRRRIRSVAADLGYVPDARAASLRRRESHTIGVVYDVDQSFQSNLLDPLYRASDRYGCDIVLAGATDHHSEANCVDELLRNRCAGLIIIGLTLDDSATEQIAARVPTLSLCRRMHASNVDLVLSDDFGGIGAAVDHLIDSGHHDIVYVDGGDFSMSNHRTRAYVRAMTENGLRDRIRVLRGGITIAEGVAAAQRILALDPLPTAAICFNDMCAFGVVEHLRLREVPVPESISVIGFDDAPISQYPTTLLTTTRQDGRLLAEAALDLLHQRLGQHAHDDATTVILPTTLVVRTTSGPAPARTASSIPGKNKNPNRFD